MYEIAKQIVDKSFRDKLDLAGQPYVYHLYRVSHGVGACPELKIVALLHDLLEDCPEWNEKSLRVFFSDAIVDEVIMLTRQKEEPYEEYIHRIAEHYWATQVKIADLRDNMDITRLSQLTDNDIKRLRKYHKAYLTLVNSENK